MKKLKDNWYMIGFVFKFAPAMFILKILTMFTSLAVNIGFNIFFFKKVVDSIIKRLHNHSRSFDQRAYGHIKSEKDIVLFGVGLGFSRGTAAAVAAV